MRDASIEIADRSLEVPAGGEPPYQAGGVLVRVLLLFIPIVTTIAFGGVDTWMIGILSVLIAVIFAIWMIGAAWGGDLLLSSDNIQLPLIGLIVLGLVQLLPLDASVPAGTLSVDAVSSLSFDPFATRLFVVRLAIYVVFFAAALTFIDTKKRVTVFAASLLVFGPAIAFFAILQRLASAEAIYGMRPTPQAIPFGPFVNQHHFAALMEMLAGLAFGVLFSRGVARDKKVLLAMGVVVMTVAIIFTGSRGGVVSFGGVVLVAAAGSFLASRSSVKRGEESNSSRGQIVLAVGAVAALIVLAVGTTVFLDQGAGLSRGIGASVSGGDFSTGRTHFWSIALKIFLDHPLIGAGLDAFGVAFTRYDSWNGTFRVEQAHNDYLQMLADAGILGFACVVAFLIFFFRRAANALSATTDPLLRGIAVGALAGCAGVLIHSFFDFPLRTPANGFFFLLLAALMIAAGRARVETT